MLQIVTIRAVVVIIIKITIIFFLTINTIIFDDNNNNNNNNNKEFADYSEKFIVVEKFVKNSIKQFISFEKYYYNYYFIVFK